MTAFAKRMIKQHGFKTKIVSTLDRREALEGADFVITAIRAGGWKPVLKGRDISVKYGIEASPDALGTGGVFGALRADPGNSGSLPRYGRTLSRRVTDELF